MSKLNARHFLRLRNFDRKDRTSARGFDNRRIMVRKREGKKSAFWDYWGANDLWLESERPSGVIE
jgi:hypothetical protein